MLRLYEIQQSSMVSCLGYWAMRDPTILSGIGGWVRDLTVFLRWAELFVRYTIVFLGWIVHHWANGLSYSSMVSIEHIQPQKGQLHTNDDLADLRLTYPFYTGRVWHSSIKCAKTKNIECVDSFILVYSVHSIKRASYLRYYVLLVNRYSSGVGSYALLLQYFS